ncbi:MAG: methyltransferase domain-containing protein [Rhodospirillales bacterium]|nr:methyltransferase domain-containing protein [Rhodospirillales bacterium]
MSDLPSVFNRRAVRRNRDRAQAGFAAHDFLCREVADRLLDRLDDVTRAFPLALDLGCRTGLIGQLRKGRGRIETLVHCDLSEKMARAASESSCEGTPSDVTRPSYDGGGVKPAANSHAVVADEEALPFAPGTFDLVLSALALHWTNDLPGALVQIRSSLKPDGLFLGALFGGETLKELRRALTEAEIEVSGGAGPRVAPFADVRDLGALLQRAGFALPVVDADLIPVSYDDPLRLMRDLRGMGEANAVAGRRLGFSRRDLFAAATERYRRASAQTDGRVTATFQIVYLTAWAPHPDQQKPLRPGSAKASLAEALIGKPKDDPPR